MFISGTIRSQSYQLRSCNNSINNLACLNFLFAECVNYRVVNDPSRSVSNTTSGGCDDSMSAIFGVYWIRFKGSGGTVIPEYAPPIHHCGANAPGWIRGDHPAVNDGIVERQLCYHFNGDECIFQYEIFIRNCGTFYVYKPPYISRCFLRLCTGKYVLTLAHS